MQKHVGIIGATSFVGEQLIPLLHSDGWTVEPFSRKFSKPLSDLKQTPAWICVAPIWVLPEYFQHLETLGARRVIALSSTSRFTKEGSTDLEEQAVALRLAMAEQRFQDWAEKNSVEWIILRPTLIYGNGRDKNVNEISRIVQRIGFFPLFGDAKGLRQPLHVGDVARVCKTALDSPREATNRAYDISGGETLSYREMVERIFNACGLKARTIRVPLWSFRLAVQLIRIVPRFRHWSADMAVRMNNDLVFDHSDAVNLLGFTPRAFLLTKADVATSCQG